ncbi:WD domain, G-beta repeat [Teratosphaeria destructans]|uniref:ASTRA-associated protein 1 n=1 Tax=Teratosphaeria destructans TaxID=418781 RepID=A0A9W7SMX8_9PEZI|nr:WD domain, G-beta repeat [Teratosphaeria destructans]
MASDASMHIAQGSTLPPAQPTYILRGHSAQIHSVCFLQDNLRLLSGDADGWVVLWDIPNKRPMAVWHAHNGTVLGLKAWGDERVITHGRDNKLCVWQLDETRVGDFSTMLPIEDAVTERKKPWLLHSLPVHALNFCSFAMGPASTSHTPDSDESEILVLYPGVQDGSIIVTSLPSEERFATIPPPRSDSKSGMLMALALHQEPSTNPSLLVIAGYEGGNTCLWSQNTTTKIWEVVRRYKLHSQPILSLDLASKLAFLYTSSADAAIAQYPLYTQADPKVAQTKHAGQQSLTVRDDEKILATAGWDGRVRVYSCKTMKELAVLKWHKEGCYALAFARSRDSGKSYVSVLEEPGLVTKKEFTVSERRQQIAKETHWLAAGSKDGKISLWNIY